RVVKDGKVTDETRWLSASEEEDYAVAQANATLTPDGRFADELVLCRKRDDYPLLAPNKIDFMDVAPEQLVSIAAALIPFLEHDDANRALMGSNMQRQSVPLLFPQAPLVGTGLEEKVACDSGAVVMARRAGVATRVTADEIIIDAGEEEAKAGDHPLARLKQHDRYRLKKFWRTNQDTAINQRPLLQLGQKVQAGQIIADGAGTERGELALGANVLVAFMPWYGHNFEDAIVLSERLVKDDVYSSIHIQELELHVRDTKRGREEITREIERGRGVACGPGRAGHRPDRGTRQGGRHPGRQDHPQGRNGIEPRREASDGHLRREGEGREGFVAQGATRHGGRGHRREDLLAHRGPGGGEGPRRADRRGARRRHRRARQDRGEVRGSDRQDPAAGRAPAGRDPARQGICGGEAQDLRGRQDGGSPREQGHHRADRARGGHAVPPGRYAGGHRAQSARGALPDERGPDSRDPPRLGGDDPRLRGEDSRVPGGGRDRDRRAAAARRAHVGRGRTAAGGAPARARLGDGPPDRRRPATAAADQRRPARPGESGDRPARGPGADAGDARRAPSVRGLPARRG